MADLPLFARLILCASATLGLTISEFIMSHYTHSITLLVVANQSFYNLITLVIGASSIAVRFPSQIVLQNSACKLSIIAWIICQLKNFELSADEKQCQVYCKKVHLWLAQSGSRRRLVQPRVLRILEFCDLHRSSSGIDRSIIIFRKPF